jgi:hypothetical protein
VLILSYLPIFHWQNSLLATNQASYKQKNKAQHIIHSFNLRTVILTLALMDTAEVSAYVLAQYRSIVSNCFTILCRYTVKIFI